MSTVFYAQVYYVLNKTIAVYMKSIENIAFYCS